MSMFERVVGALRSPFGSQEQQLRPQQMRPQQFRPQRRSGNTASLSLNSMSAISGATCTRFDDDDALENAPLPVPTGAASAEPDPDVSHEGPLSLSTRIEYSALPRGREQVVFGLVTIQSSASEAAVGSASSDERQPMDIVCVLDVSGSMGSENKIQDLKGAVRFIVDESKPQDRLSIVAFNSSATRNLKLRRMDNEGKDNAISETLRLNAGGGTSIAAGLDMGLAVLEQRRQRNKVSAILLLTDGQDNSTHGHLNGLMQRANVIGCSLYAFGFGKDHDANLMQQISEQARTPFTYVETTSSIRQAFAGVVGGLSSIVAQNVEIRLNCQVHLKHMHTPFQNQLDGERLATITIPDIFAGERRDILLELAVPADLLPNGEGSAVLLEATARYVDLRRGRGCAVVQTLPAAMTIQRTEEPQPEMEPDVEVTDQRERVEVARVLEEAARCSDDRRFEEAKVMLGNQRSKISKHKAPSPVLQALDQELEDAEHRMKDGSAWQTGQAEVKDALQMHKMQRCTNTMASATSKLSVQKKSKAMYCSAQQTEWISKATSSSSGR